jgi:chromosome segregation ATPase
MTIAELVSAKAQLEASLRDLRRELEQTRRQVALLTANSTGPEDRVRTSTLLEKAQRTAIEVERRRLQIESLNQQLLRAGAVEASRDLADLSRGDEAIQAEIDALRQSVLATLRSLAEPLRRYQSVVDRKTAVASRLAAMTHRDRSYANYMDCSLIRRQEYDEDLRFVLESLQKTRVVS